MIIKTMDASFVRKCFLAGANAIDAKKEVINDLNVFPVPDGDTGTNMTMTIMSAAKEVAALENPDMKSLGKAISGGSLRGARGNSGVILSQLLRGFTKEVSKVDEVDVDVLTKAFERAVESAYKAVMKPKEGTILTVARGGADKAIELNGRTDNIAEFMNSVIMHMRDVLEQTPELLPVLKEAGVVDSGGEGLVTVLEGAYTALIGKEVKIDVEPAATPVKKPSMGADAGVVAEADIKFGYCTEFIIMLEKPFGRKEEMEFKAFLESIGDSIVCVADEKIDNMREEHHERVIKNASEMAKQQKQEEKKVEFKENGFISVSVGDGLTDLFHELGVDEVIEGGQTMNPSTEDILGAIEKIPAKNIYILPNNGNIILAAQQAKDLTKDKAVHVIPTKNIPQGIAAMINFVEGFTPEQNEEAMTEALSEVKSGQVTYAVRDTVIDGKEIKAGNIMGLSDKTIEIVGTDVVDTTIDLLKKMMDEESELITIYYGEEGTKEDAEKIAKAIEGIDDEMEVEIQYGGQPIYYYFVSVE